MDYREIEKKWQKKWSEDNLYKFDEDNMKEKFYLLEMLIGLIQAFLFSLLTAVYIGLLTGHEEHE